MMVRLQTVCRVLPGKGREAQQWREEFRGFVASHYPDRNVQIFGDFANPSTYHVVGDYDDFAGIDDMLALFADDKKLSELWGRQAEFTENDTTRFILTTE